MPNPILMRRLMGGVATFVFLDFTAGIPSDYTHARASNATMHDSVGTLVFAENNLFCNTNDLTVANSWIVASGVVIDDVDLITYPTGTNGQMRATVSGTTNPDANVVGASYEIIFEARKVSGADTIVLRARHSDAVKGNTDGSNITLTTEYQDVGVSGVIPESATSAQAQLRGAVGNTGGQVQVRNIRMVRTPMVGGSIFINNPTTSSFYGARAPSHVFDGSGWLNEGYLHEGEARTNLIIQSDALATTWTLPGANTTITDNAGVALTGLTTADDVLHGDSAETVQQTVTLTADTVTCLSAVVEQGDTGEHDFVKIALIDNSDGANGPEAWFNIATGAAGTAQADGTGAITDSGIIDMSGGKYRIWVSGTITAGQTDGRVELINTTADAVDTAEATNSVYWSSIQLEVGQSPSSINPTVLTSVTRAADALLKGTSGVILPEINPLAYTIVVKGMANPGSLADGTTRRMFEAASDALASDNPKLQLVMDASTAGTATFNNVLAASTKTWNPTTSNTAGVRHAYGVAADAAGGISSFNGVTGATEPAFTPEPGFDKIGWGGDFAGGNGYMGHIRSGFIGTTKDSQGALNARATV